MKYVCLHNIYDSNGVNTLIIFDMYKTTSDREPHNNSRDGFNMSVTERNPNHWDWGSWKHGETSTLCKKANVEMQDIINGLSELVRNL